MKWSTLVPLGLLLSACATQTPVETGAGFAANFQPNAASAPQNDDSATITEIKTVTAAEADSGRICKSEKRPGSNITRRVCHTQAEWVARQEASKEQLEDLRHEQRWRDEIIRQHTLEGTRPRGFGLGPN